MYRDQLLRSSLTFGSLKCKLPQIYYTLNSKSVNWELSHWHNPCHYPSLTSVSRPLSVISERKANWHICRILQGYKQIHFWSYILTWTIPGFDNWQKSPPLCTQTSKSFSDNKLPLLCAICKPCDQWHPSSLKLPEATGMIIGLWRGNSGALDSACAIVIKKPGLILPYPSPTYWKPLNWWMRTLWEMAGVVMVVIFLQMYPPLGWWREGWTTTFLDPEQAERYVGWRCHIGRG